MKNHYFLDSSFIVHAQIEKSSTLIITFASGSVWAYYDVPPHVYEEFTTSESHGKYFNNNIRNVYSSEVLFKLSKDSKIIYSKDYQIEQKEEQVQTQVQIEQ
jgi:UDP-N-acetylglucosamine pyrophosphorylase